MGKLSVKPAQQNKFDNYYNDLLTNIEGLHVDNDNATNIRLTKSIFICIASLIYFICKEKSR